MISQTVLARKLNTRVNLDCMRFFSWGMAVILLSLSAIFLKVQGIEAASINVPILTYHYVANNPNPKDTQRDALSVPPTKFEAQMDYLSKNGFTPITLDTLYGIFNKQTTPPNKPIILTFDDGYNNFYTIVFPILKHF